MNAQTQTTPMSTAEFDQCCGKHHWGEHPELKPQCENCPLLIERRRHDVLRAARAL
jgi:hypothetical protein